MACDDTVRRQWFADQDERPHQDLTQLPGVQGAFCCLSFWLGQPQLKRGREAKRWEGKDGEGERREERKETHTDGYTQVITNKSMLPSDAGYKTLYPGRLKWSTI